MEEQFLAFDWHGYLAHFRKLDTNSSSLSYLFPPPTVISGMLAGICGMERDLYYSIFTPDQIQYGIQVRKKPRKIMQTVNYMFAKSRNDLNISNQTPHTQIPLELLVAESFPNEFLSFRIFLKIMEPNLFNELNSHLSEKRQLYLPYLGSASFQSWLQPRFIKNVSIVNDSAVHSVVPVKAIKDISMLLKTSKEPPAIFCEHMRRFFSEGREPGEMIDLIWEKNSGTIHSDFSTPVYRIHAEEDVTRVIFF